MIWLAAILPRLGITARTAKWIGIAVLAVAAILFVRHMIRKDATIAKQEVVIQGQEAVIAAGATNGAAKDAAAIQGAVDADRIITNTKERNDAIDKAADGAPSDAAVAYGCLRLKRAGRDTSAIPACR